MDDRPPPAADGPPAWFLLATAAASGAAVMIVEMTAVRALQPAFGSTTMVWAHVIATVLAALALGGWLGGRVADRHPSPTVLFGILGAGGLLVAVSALLVGPASRLFADDAVDPGGLAGTLARGSLGTTLLVFAPPLFLLGAVTPLTLRLLAHRGVGRAAGAVIGLSTAGSIVGTYLPALVLVPHLGSRGSLLAAAALLAIPAAIGLARSRRGLAAAAALLAALGGAAAAHASAGPIRPAPVLPGGGPSVLLAERESPYQYLAVREDRPADGPTARVLTINEAVHSWHSLRVEGRVLTGVRAYDDYATLPLLLDLAPGAELRVSVLGFACGVNAATWRHFWDGPFRLRVDGAEIDPEVLALGREYFGLDPAARADAADGRPWLRALPAGERRHLIVVDAFARELYVPFHLATREFFEEARARLEPGGLLAMNCWAMGESSPNLAAIENTLATVFGSCLRVSQHGGENYLLLARAGGGAPETGGLDPVRARKRFGDRPGVAEWDALLAAAAIVAGDAEVVRPRSDKPVLTDDHAPVEWLTDRFLQDLEEFQFGEREDSIYRPLPERIRALKDLRTRQHLLLAGIGAAWAALLAAAFLKFGRASKV